MTTAVPVAVLRAFAWVVLLLSNAFAVYLLVRAFTEPTSSVTFRTSPGSTVSVDVAGILVSIPFFAGGIILWAGLLAFAGAVEAVVQIRDLQMYSEDEA